MIAETVLRQDVTNVIVAPFKLITIFILLPYLSLAPVFYQGQLARTMVWKKLPETIQTGINSAPHR